jgi:glutamyl-tRNA reductase
MELLCLGLSHKSAPIGVRERLALSAEHQEQVLRSLCAAPAEAMVLSTCNRVEFYLVAADLQRAKGAALEEICARIGSESTEHLYEHRGDAALVHLFRVACSLDSMVVGEAQILGQVKEAFELAQRVGAAGGELTRACSAAFTAAKRVRSETGIGRAPVSMASAAVELAEKIFGGLSGKTVLMVGAGEIAELTVKHLHSAGASQIVIVNRTPQRAEALASILGATARPFEELPALLIAADMVISSTASPTPVFTPETVSPVLKSRRFRPLFMLDIAVPRDIAPEVNQLDGVYAYDVDDIQKVVVENTATRGAEAEKAEALIAEEIAKFVRARSVRDGVPVLALLRARADQIARAELEKTLSNLGEGLSEKQRRSIESMATAIINKLLHLPTAKLREASLEEGVSRLAGAAAELFGLEETPAPPDPPPGAQRGRPR